MIDQVYDTSNIDDMMLSDESLTMKDEQGSIYSIDGKKLYKGALVNKLIVYNGVEIICDKALYSKEPNSVIKEIVLPDTVKAIGNLAFFNNVELHTINIPSSVETINNNPFAGCHKLKSRGMHVDSKRFAKFYENLFIDINNKKLISAIAVDENGLVNFSINKWIESIGAYAFWYYKNEINFRQTPFLYKLKEIGNYAFGGITSQLIDLSDTIIEEIPEGCFRKAKVKEVLLPYRCRKIGKNAFSNSDIEYINLKNITFVDSFAFCNCKNLSVVSLQNVKVIEQQAFASCSISGELKLYDIDKIGDWAFLGCPLSTVEIIGDKACIIGKAVFEYDKLESFRSNKEVLDNENVKLYKYTTLLVAHDEPLFYKTGVYVATKRIEPTITAYGDIKDKIEKSLGISCRTIYYTILRMLGTDKNIWGISTINLTIIPPMFDNIDAFCSMSDFYLKTENRSPQATLFQLFYNCNSVYSEYSIDGFQINKITAKFKLTYNTDTPCDYDDNKLSTEFLDFRDNRDCIETEISTKFVSFQKDNKIAVIVKGNFVTDFEFDRITGIDNVFIEKENVTIPIVSINYVKVWIKNDGKDYCGILDESGNIVLPIYYTKIYACMNYVLADNQLYIWEKTGLILICDNIDSSLPVFIYKGAIALFKSNNIYYVYRERKLSKVEGDKYVFYSSEDYMEYYDIKADYLYIEDNERFDDYDNGYSQDELNDMYRDAFDGYSEYESNID